MISRLGLTYATVPGFRPLLLDLHRPADPAPAPVVVWIHGGGFQSGDRRYLPDTLEPGSLFAAATSAGLAVATIDYRLSGEAHFPAQLADVSAALDYLRCHTVELGLDGERIAIWGESAGGTLAALAALTDGGLRAAVCWYPLTDLMARWPERTDSPRRCCWAARRPTCPSSPRWPARWRGSGRAPRRSCWCTAPPTPWWRARRASGCTSCC